MFIDDSGCPHCESFEGDHGIFRAYYTGVEIYELRLELIKMSLPLPRDEYIVSYHHIMNVFVFAPCRN